MKIENLILSSLIHNTEYARAVLPFVKDEYFRDQSERNVFNIINEFYKNTDKLITIDDPNKIGNLHCINKLNFSPTKRIFYIDNFKNEELPIKRGGHAIINFREFLIILEGKIKLILTDKNNSNKEIYLEKNDTFLINYNTWINYEILDNNTKILVLCDKEYSESIKETDFKKFISQ